MPWSITLLCEAKAKHSWAQPILDSGSLLGFQEKSSLWNPLLQPAHMEGKVPDLWSKEQHKVPSGLFACWPLRSPIMTLAFGSWCYCISGKLLPCSAVINGDDQSAVGRFDATLVEWHCPLMLCYSIIMSVLINLLLMLLWYTYKQILMEYVLRLHYSLLPAI